MRNAVIFVALLLGVELALGMTLFKRRGDGGKGGPGGHARPHERCHPPPMAMFCKKYVAPETGVTIDQACAQDVQDPETGANINVGTYVNNYLTRLSTVESIDDPFFDEAKAEVDKAMARGEELFGEMDSENAPESWSDLTPDQQGFISAMCYLHGCAAKTIMSHVQAGDEEPPYCATVEKPSMEEMEEKIDDIEDGDMSPSAEDIAKHDCFIIRKAKKCGKKMQNMMGRSLHTKTGGFKRVLNNLSARDMDDGEMPEMPDFENMTEDELKEFFEEHMDEMKAKKQAKMNEVSGQDKKAALLRALKRLLA